MTDHDALNDIAAVLNGTIWTADTVTAIADIVRTTTTLAGTPRIVADSDETDDAIDGEFYEYDSRGLRIAGPDHDTRDREGYDGDPYDEYPALRCARCETAFAQVRILRDGGYPFACPVCSHAVLTEANPLLLTGGDR